eukprot:scaffold137351_cov35-Tisochrysis_lutea.AAC.1
MSSSTTSRFSPEARGTRSLVAERRVGLAAKPVVPRGLSRACHASASSTNCKRVVGVVPALEPEPTATSGRRAAAPLRYSASVTPWLASMTLVGRWPARSRSSVRDHLAHGQQDWLARKHVLLPELLGRQVGAHVDIGAGLALCHGLGYTRLLTRPSPAVANRKPLVRVGRSARRVDCEGVGACSGDANERGRGDGCCCSKEPLRLLHSARPRVEPREG